MILALYCMVVCFCAYVAMQGYDIEVARAIVLFIGIAFFWIASGIYDKTINKLKNEIKELKKEIDNLKE